MKKLDYSWLEKLNKEARPRGHQMQSKAVWS